MNTLLYNLIRSPKQYKIVNNYINPYYQEKCILCGTGDYCYYKLGVFNNLGGSLTCCDTAYLCPIAFNQINNMYQNILLFNEMVIYLDIDIMNTIIKLIYIVSFKPQCVKLMPKKLVQHQKEYFSCYSINKLKDLCVELELKPKNHRKAEYLNLLHNYYK